MNLKVLKFGGTSLGSPRNMRLVMKIIADNKKKIVVLSAMSGTTNALVEISELLSKKDKKAAGILIDKLEGSYRDVVNNLYEYADNKEKGDQIIITSFEVIKSSLTGRFTQAAANTIISMGEIISTKLFTLLMEENGHDVKLLPALDFMRIGKDKMADLKFITENIRPVLEEAGDAKYYITQGYICRNASGGVDSMQRGGSDYTASLIGAAIDAEEIQIWTDIDGIHNNDPRYVENTKKISRLSFFEAAELAYFGAKILHPQTIYPARIHNIPVRLKNTLNPSDPGTLITSETSGKGIKAVAAKDGITAIKIRSDRMLMAYGFLESVFKIFAKYKTPIDMISTSEVALSLTIDNSKNIKKILEELDEYGTVAVDYNMTIICIVGDIIGEERGFASKVFHALDGIPIRMISYGGSRFNISILVPDTQKEITLKALSKNLLNHS